MSSVREVIVTDSRLTLVTTTLKVKVPPGSGRVAGEAVLSTTMVGTRLVMATTASSSSVAVEPSSSTAMAVTTSRC